MHNDHITKVSTDYPLSISIIETARAIIRNPKCASSRKNLTILHGLISDFLLFIKTPLGACKILIFQLVSVAESTDLTLT